MQKTSLKHYRRKKFFHHLLMRSSPRSGGLFGMGLILSAILLKPLWVWGLIRLHFIGQKFFWLGAGAMLLLNIALYFTGSMFIAGSQRKRRIGNFVTGDFWRHHTHQVLILAAAISLLVLAGGYWLAQLAILLLMVLFFVYAPEKRRRKLKKAAFIPVLLCAGMIVGVHALVILHEEALRARIMLLAKTTGPGVRREGLIELEQQGFPMEREPFKTMLTSFRRDDDGYSASDSPAEAARNLGEYRKRHPRFVAALEAFTALQPHYIGHRIPDLVHDTELPAEAFRAGAAYCAWLIQTADGDREAIRAANVRLQNLRDWMLNSQFRLEHLTGNGIENIRIQALAGSLPRAKWSCAEFRELLGKPPHWQGVFLRSRASETLVCAEYIDRFRAGIFGDDPKNRVPERLLPDAWRLYFLADGINLLDRQFEAIRLLSAAEFDQLPEAQRINAMEMPEQGYFISEFISGTAASEWRSYVRTDDRRRMAELACMVMDLYRRQGKLPADLSFLPETPVTRLDRRKIELETGEFPGDDDRTYYGFRLKIADSNRFHTDIVVRLADTPPKP